MKFIVRVEDIKNALKKAKLTISPSDTNVVLQNFAIRAEDDKITIIATDLQLATVCVIAGNVERPGTTTLPGMKLISIVDNSSSDEFVVDLDDDGKNATVKSGEYVAKLVTMPYDDYPRLEDFSQENSIKTDRLEMLNKLNRISFSVSDNEAKRNLLAVFINEGMMQATDGQVTTAIEFDKNVSNTLIPALAVKDLVRILRQSETPEVELNSTDSFLLFKLNNDVFMTRLSSAKFPDITKKIINPTNKNDVLLKANRAKLKAAIGRVGITASDKSLAVCFDIAAQNGSSRLTLSSNDLLGNASSEQMDVEFSGSENTKIYFNYTRVIDILNALKEDEVVFKMHTNAKVPVRVEEDKPTFLCFTMRLREQVIAQPTSPSPDGPTGELADEI